MPRVEEDHFGLGDEACGTSGEGPRYSRVTPPLSIVDPDFAKQQMELMLKGTPGVKVTLLCSAALLLVVVPLAVLL